MVRYPYKDMAFLPRERGVAGGRKFESLKSWSGLVSAEMREVLDLTDERNCEICMKGQETKGNTQDPLLTCAQCDVTVHQSCYRNNRDTQKMKWLCDVCELQKKPKDIQCVICFERGNALKLIDNNQDWVHCLCANWIPEVYLDETGAYNLSRIPPGRYKLRCRLCRRSGAIVQCSQENCVVSAHPWCAVKESFGFACRVSMNENQEITRQIFCQSHSSLMKKTTVRVKALSGIAVNNENRKCTPSLLGMPFELFRMILEYLPLSQLKYFHFGIKNIALRDLFHQSMSVSEYTAFEELTSKEIRWLYQRDILVRSLRLNQFSQSEVDYIRKFSSSITSLTLRGDCTLRTKLKCPSLIGSCPSLTTLFLIEWYHLTNKQVENVLKPNPQLKRLKLYSLYSLNNITIFNIGKYCPNLYHLNLSGNEWVKDNSVICIIERCPSLKSINVRRTSITTSGLKQIATNFPKLESFKFTRINFSLETFMELFRPFAIALLSSGENLDYFHDRIKYCETFIRDMCDHLRGGLSLQAPSRVFALLHSEGVFAHLCTFLRMDFEMVLPLFNDIRSLQKVQQGIISLFRACESNFLQVTKLQIEMELLKERMIPCLFRFLFCLDRNLRTHAGCLLRQIALQTKYNILLEEPNLCSKLLHTFAQNYGEAFEVLFAFPKAIGILDLRPLITYFEKALETEFSSVCRALRTLLSDPEILPHLCPILHESTLLSTIIERISKISKKISLSNSLEMLQLIISIDSLNYSIDIHVATTIKKIWLQKDRNISVDRMYRLFLLFVIKCPDLQMLFQTDLIPTMVYCGYAPSDMVYRLRSTVDIVRHAINTRNNHFLDYLIECGVVHFLISHIPGFRVDAPSNSTATVSPVTSQEIVDLCQMMMKVDDKYDFFFRESNCIWKSIKAILLNVPDDTTSPIIATNEELIEENCDVSKADCEKLMMLSRWFAGTGRHHNEIYYSGDDDNDEEY